MRRELVVVLVALVVGCKKKDRAVGVRPGEGLAAGSAMKPSKVEKASRVAGTPAKRGSLKRDPFAFYGVILPAGTDTSKLEAVAKKQADVHFERTTPAEAGWHAESASYYGDSYPSGDLAAINKATDAVVIGYGGADAAHLAGTSAVSVATATKGWIVDIQEHQLYTADTLRAHLPEVGARIDVRKLIMVHQVAGDDKLAFLDTAGLAKFGLPELYLADVPPSRAGEMTTILNATAQTLIEAGDLPRDGELDVDVAKLSGDWHRDDLQKAGGTGKITWRVQWGHGDAAPADDVDTEDLVLELSLAGAKPGSPEALLAATETYLGPVQDKARKVKYHDELAAAGVKARAALLKLKPRFAKGMPPGEHLGVKVPFKTDSDGIEWMWVDVVSFKGAMVDGVLDNDPDDVSSLKLGQRVQVKFDDIADFIYADAAGKKSGGYSLEVLRSHGEDVPPL